jgi:leucyl-tRNA synthetase
MLNGLKMSKSTGNFLTIDDCITKYGVDATRIGLADSGDGLDDANFDEKVANAALLKLSVIEQWIKAHISTDGLDFAKEEYGNLKDWDKIVINECKRVSKEARESYAKMKIKNVVKLFNEFISLKETYSIAT